MNIQLSNDLLTRSLALTSELGVQQLESTDSLEVLKDSLSPHQERSGIISELLNDPEEDIFFRELKDRVRRENPAGLRVIELFSSSLRASIATSLSDTACERVAELLSSALPSPEVIGLALEILTVSQHNYLSLKTSTNEILAVSALLYLERTEPHLSIEHRDQIYAIARKYRFPLGTVKNGVVSFENLSSDLDGPTIDIAGAGCVLLLSRFSNEDLFNLQYKTGELLEDLAISFSKTFPSSPNLWISVMANADYDALTLLDNYQRNQLPNEKIIEIAKNALNEVFTTSLVLFPTIQGVIKGLNMPARGIWQSIGATFLTTGVGGMLRFMSAFLDELKKHKLSKEHKLQLKAAMNEIKEVDSEIY